MKTPNENWIHGLGIGILVLVNITGNPIPQGTGLVNGLLTWLALILVVGVQWMSIVWCVRRSWQRYPGLDQVRLRLLASFALSILLVMPMMALSDLAVVRLMHNQVFVMDFGKLFFYFFNSIILCFTGIGATEAVYFYTRLRKSEQEKEELHRINLHAQYDSLKQQVNPHFLFNSLNSLSSLITIDPPKAEKFVEELSQVYRYLLQSNEDELTTLGKELGFIKSYLHLLQTRFGGGLQVGITVGEAAKQCLIPPLTLQLLVENAVKHNEVSLANPLQLRIEAEGTERLRVSNKLRRRSITVPSAQVGLANIIARYRLLDHPFVEVKEAEGEFVVVLPLIREVRG